MAITLDGTNGVTTPDLTVDTDTLTVDATNNRVGIGTASPSANLHISDTGEASILISADTDNDAGEESGFLEIRTDNEQVRHRVEGAGSGNNLEIIAGATGTTTAGISSNIIFQTKASGASATERMRINSDGRIGVASSGLTAVQFAMEINGQSWFAVWDDDAGNDKFRVASSGNVQNSNNSYGAISDQKLKENIVDTTNKLEDLKRVQIKNYNFIGDSQKQIGVIAQELETVFPSMVEEHPDLDEDGNDLGTVTKSVKYSVFVPILIKSLQEQQTIIEDLKTRIEALEAGV